MDSLPASFFDLVERSLTPVLVEFGAEWCGPCRVMGPVLEKAAAEFKGRLLVTKVDIDRKPRLAAYYNIQSVPTLLLFIKGKLVWRQTGSVPYAALKNSLETQLPSDFYRAG